MNTLHHRHPRQTSGFMLLEALFGILLFSLGIIALIGLQANSVKQSVAGQYRSEAGMMADQLIGQMWASNRSMNSLQADFNSDHIGATNCTAQCGGNFLAWYEDVKANLPGSIDHPPTVLFESIPGSAAGLTSTRATVTLFWRAPNEDTSVPVHKYTVIAQIK